MDYKTLIQNYTAEQLIQEISIVNEQYKTEYNKKKMLDEEIDRRRKENRKGV